MSWGAAAGVMAKLPADHGSASTFGWRSRETPVFNRKRWSRAERFERNPAMEALKGNRRKNFYSLGG